MGVGYYEKMIEEVVMSPETFDLRSLYCSFYRYLFTDVHYAAIDSKEPEQFKSVVCSIVEYTSVMVSEPKSEYNNYKIKKNTCRVAINIII